MITGYFYDKNRISKSISISLIMSLKKIKDNDTIFFFNVVKHYHPLMVDFDSVFIFKVIFLPLSYGWISLHFLYFLIV